MLEPELVEHTLEPVFDGNSRVLILGTMPSPKSREAGFYYGHPQNRFWPCLAALFDEPVPETTEDRRQFALDHGIALWDVLASCRIAGASDSSITDARPNDLNVVLASAPIELVCTTGAKAASLYRRFDLALYPDLPHRALPSTSAANASMRLPHLVEAYAVVREVIEGASEDL